VLFVGLCQRAALLLFIILTACTPFVPRRPLTSYFKEVETLLAAQEYSQAARLLEEAAQAHPEDTRSLLRLGQIYLRQGQPVAAEDAFNRALARNLSYAPAMAGLAEAKLHQGDLGQALHFWQEAAEVNPDLPGVYTGLGRTHLLRFEFEQAEEAFLTQQARRPDPEAQWYLAALAAPSEFTAANNYLLSIPHNAAADILARRDYLLAALVPFTTESAQAEIAQAVGIAFVQVEQWPLAVHALTAAAQYPEQSAAEKAESLAFLGHALAQAGRPALDLFEQAAALNPDSALPLYFYGLYLREQGALNAAEATFIRAIELDPDNAAIYIELADTKAEQGIFSAAEQYYQAAARIAPDDPRIQLLAIQFYANRGYRLAEEGIPAAQALIEEDPNNAEAYDLLGWMQLLIGATAEAETSLRKAIELDPHLISAHYHLARSLETGGKITEAIDQYRHVVETDTTGLFRSRAIEALSRLEQSQ